MDVTWMVQLREMDQRAMLRDLDAAIERARATGEPRIIERCLDTWQRQVESMAREPRRERRRRMRLDGSFSAIECLI